MDSASGNAAKPPPDASVDRNPRFVAPQATADDLLQSQTIGLVQLSDFRKRRAEVLEQSAARRAGDSSGASTPSRNLTSQAAKKKRKNAARGKLSFADDEDDSSGVSTSHTPRPGTPNLKADDRDAEGDDVPAKRKLGPNSNVVYAPKALTKSALVKEAQTREQLRKEFLALQASVKATEIVIPFVFYDGTNIPGGMCRVKKGDHVWFFLDKARKVGAERGVGSDTSRKGWARISIDDLMLVRGGIILPPHYEFYYFMMNKSIGFNGRILDFSSEPTAATPAASAEADEAEAYDPLSSGGKPKKEKIQGPQLANDELEGFGDDPTLTKVVDRRWFEKNKHIYPASLWEEFDPTKDYSKGLRKDTVGNALFFS